MSGPLTLYALRHGEVFNPHNVWYGRLPGFKLSDVGRHQALMAGRALKDKPINAFYCSPMQRTKETADLVISQHPSDFDVVVEERINEVHAPFEGVPNTTLEKTMFDIYTGNEPPHELPPDLRKRALSFVSDLRARHTGEHVAMVTHGDVIVALFLWAMQQPDTDIGRNRLADLGLPEYYPATASIHTFTFKTDAEDEIPHYQYLRPY